MACRIYPPQVKQEALQLYFQGTRLPDIARELRVPYGTVHNWQTTGKWTDVLRRIQAEIQDEWRQKILDAARKQSLIVWAGQLRLCQGLTEIMGQCMSGDKKLTSKEILELAKALNTEFKVFEKLFNTVFPQPAIE
ncbi:MAG: hypothetical protein A2283_17790 [Lentisphaerae bacterium RIFOXYA12_FULL_48_11]|nr:MAG: hypothetical protein A2283_17790 [Lentisphaerae bacterium RIFOXYA12_FULL_48_11]